MPTAYQHACRREAQKEELLRRIDAGEGLCAICADPHMPNVVTVYRWFPADPGFQARLRQALSHQRWRRHRAFDEAQAKVLLKRLRAGEALRDILRDPAMPNYATLRYWRATQVYFAGEVAEVVDRRRRERGGALRRSPIPDYDPATADRVLLLAGRGHSCKRLRQVDPALPTYRTIRAWRRRAPQFDEDLKANMRLGRYAHTKARRLAVLQALKDGIVQGGSFRSLAGRNGLPSRRTLSAWANRYPDFACEVAQACEDREDWYHDQLSLLAEAVTPATVAETRRLMAPLNRQLARLKNRPGKKWRRE